MPIKTTTRKHAGLTLRTERRPEIDLHKMALALLRQAREQSAKAATKELCHE